MDLSPWKVILLEGWDRNFVDFDRSVQIKIMNRLDQMEQTLPGRGLHGSPFRIEEVGGYRIAYEQDEKTRTKLVHFVGSHKQYGEWFHSI